MQCERLEKSRGLYDGLTTAKNLIFITFYSRIRECVSIICVEDLGENDAQKESCKMLHGCFWVLL